ncbi:DNA methyltransferase [Nocardia fluminea]|uniref:DNA methyltransferase n=1 Tax=Nocardia fluminea TaxID=134984 RepID=UPI00366E659D
MARPVRRRTPTTNAAELHRGWLELVDSEGPFLAIPPLKRIWPNGIPDFRKTHPDRFDVLVDARKDFESAWEALDRNPDGETTLGAYRAARDKWVETVLRDVAGWAESLSWGEVPGAQAQSPNRIVTVTAQAALHGVYDIGALVHVVDPVDSLRQTPRDLWAATAVDRLEALLRENKVEIGIVTDGRWWGLVCAREGSMAASGIVDALTWIEEPRTRDAFLTLIGRQHIIGGDPAERLPVLFGESVAAAEEITEALGAQVRRAVELLIQSFSESAADAHRRGLPDPLPAHTHDTYEAAVTVMMRVVFLLFAEERGLLPTGELFEQGYGISRELSRLVARESEESEEALDATSLTWHRLLATSHALFSGASFEGLRMPAYGGSLFDPTRFPFLLATNEQGTLAVTVSDRVMLHVLRSVQLAVLKGGEARQISFRDIDVEQIGYIYEGLLGYTCVTVGETYLGLVGKTGEEPEISLSRLEEFATANPEPKKLAAVIRAWIEEDQPSATPPSAAAIVKAINADVDPSVVSSLTRAVGDDHELRERVRPWLGIVRQDLRTHPFVVLAGGLLVKETPSRKNAGAHYTPKSLAEEVVLHALQPLCYSPGPHQITEESAWKLKSSDELLDLKVADIACGSGAFLVAAARYLADRLVEAWISEDPLNAHRKDLYRRAIRQVVANCLYGADINDMAVEMCKLSLWLVSLDRDLPFSFVDDKVFVGNSLLGLTSLEQLRKLHIDPSRAPSGQMFDIFDVDIDSIIRKAVDLRQRLATEIAEDDPARTSAAKRRQLAQLHDVTASLRQIADGVIGAGLPLGGKPGKALDEAYDNLRQAVKAAHPGPTGGVADSTWLDKIIGHGLTPTVVTDYERWQPLHWLIEVPDVIAERNGFDSLIGNPPFLGSNKTPGAIGENMHDWYASVVGHGVKAKADMVAFFLLRACGLLNVGGSMGLIATHAVTQGDTREVGLDALSADGLELTRAIQSRPWPASAGASYAAVWATRSEVSDAVQRNCDGVLCYGISTLLEPTGKVEGRPKKLAENAGKAFNGCYLLGMGFVVTRDVVDAWIAADPRNAQVLFRYLNGDDLNGQYNSDASQWVIDFNDLDYASASLYVLPMEHVRTHVKPDRDGNPRKAVAERWWQYAEKRPGMRRALHDLDYCIAIRQSSNTLIPTIVATDQVIDQTVVVFGSSSMHLLGVLSSSVHQVWVAMHGLRTMAGVLRYTPSDVFDTFPFPDESADVEVVSQRLFDERSRIMCDRELGLTKLYKLVNDPEVSDASDPAIRRLRELHVDLDSEVMRAYGWEDIPLEHGFVEYRKARRWTVSASARLAILDRLLEENHQRAAAEEACNKGGTRRRKLKGASEGQEELFS